ncbi:amiloride-sensitive sodium channel subunit beta-like [Haliotis rubra]|uniref:amiloride-sensitive sodium channel subunit beta-like n=1 Tax=Haliotis rubra TaxID=36100 RepID=UPI001EE5EEDC|nr:amiloride-sensitive sodium channel subunit beta-like [Haliotis rubra]
MFTAGSILYVVCWWLMCETHQSAKVGVGNVSTICLYKMSSKTEATDGPTCTEEKIGSLWTDFTQSTGLHGVNKLTPGRNHKIRCFSWTVAVLVMTGYMTYNITQELMNYYRRPVITNTKVEVIEELPFPAVTFCNLSPFNLTKIKAVDPYLEEYFTKTSLLGPLTGNINWSDPGYGSTFRKSHKRDWWENIYMAPKEMFTSCLMNGVGYYPCTAAMKPILTLLGLCATFNWNASDVAKVRLTGSNYNLILNANIDQANYVHGAEVAAGMKVILHDPRVHPDLATSSFLAAPGTSTYASVHRSTYEYLPPPYQAFRNRTCVDTLSPSFDNTLQYFDTYTYENCLQECITKLSHDRCGCIQPGDNESIGQICSLYNFTTCYVPEYISLRQNATIQKSCGCQVPCSFETYDVKLSTSRYPSDVTVALTLKLGLAPDEEFIRDNLLEIRMFYEKLVVQSTTQTPQYTTETIIGNLGGQMGICLGASILTLTELGEFLLFLILTILSRWKYGREVKHIKPIQH